MNNLIIVDGKPHVAPRLIINTVHEQGMNYIYVLQYISKPFYTKKVEPLTTGKAREIPAALTKGGIIDDHDNIELIGDLKTMTTAQINKYFRLLPSVYGVKCNDDKVRDYGRIRPIDTYIKALNRYDATTYAVICKRHIPKDENIDDYLNVIFNAQGIDYKKPKQTKAIPQQDEG